MFMCVCTWALGGHFLHFFHRTLERNVLVGRRWSLARAGEFQTRLHVLTCNGCVSNMLLCFAKPFPCSALTRVGFAFASSRDNQLLRNSLVGRRWSLARTGVSSKHNCKPSLAKDVSLTSFAALPSPFPAWLSRGLVLHSLPRVMISSWEIFW
jgi:hypothetical protein